MTCKECNGTGWIINRMRVSEMSNATIQTRCTCGYWIKKGLKFEKNPNYLLRQQTKEVRNG